MSKVYSYLNINAPAEGEYKDRGSKFLAYLFPIESEDDVKFRLEEVKKAHPKARHHCYAYRLEADGSVFRYHDDGEPSGTAGKPILGQFIKSDLTNIVGIVVRYFGGTKLGTGGLIKAYRGSIASAIGNSTIRTFHLKQRVKITFEYRLLGVLMDGIKAFGGEIESQSFSDSAFVIVSFPAQYAKYRIHQVTAHVSGISVEEMIGKNEVTGLKYEFL